MPSLLVLVELAPEITVSKGLKAVNWCQQPVLMLKLNRQVTVIPLEKHSYFY